MNWTTRNIIVVLLGALSSVIAIALLSYLQLRGGEAIYGITLWQYVPAGAIGAGLLAASGYYFGSRALRLRPSPLMVVAMVVFSVGSVYLLNAMQAGYTMMGRKPVTSFAALGQFVGYSLTNSPVRMAFAGGAANDEDEDASSAPAAPTNAAAAGAAPGVAQLQSDSNQNVQGIGGGVQGMLATGNALSADNMSTAMTGAKQRIQVAQSFGANLLAHKADLELVGLQLVGFLLGGLLAYINLRSLSYCDNCLVFLSKKGEQTRYFDSAVAARGSVDEFLTQVKGRKYRESIESHSEEGSAQKKKTSSFASTVEISRCAGCHKHRLKFTARRKDGSSWKDISMLGYTAFCLEKLDIAKNLSPSR